MGLLDPYYRDQIKGFEGFTPSAAWDYKQHSNGFGTRARFPGEVVDQAEAENRLSEETEKAARAVDAFHPTLDKGTRAALTSLTFNAGTGWMNAGLGQAIKAGDMDTARHLFTQYNKAGGQYLPGLADRRAKEVEWFGKEPTDNGRGMYDEGYEPSKTTPKIAAALTGQGQTPMTATPISAVYDPNEMTPEAVALQRKLAMQLLGQGSDISPVGHPLAALARAIQGFSGGVQRDTANAAEQRGHAGANALLAQAVKGGGDVGATIAAGLANPWAAQTMGPIATQFVGKRMEEESPAGKIALEAQQEALKKAKAPTWGVIGQNNFGQPSYGWIDPKAQTVTRAPGAAPASASASNLSGDAYLATLDKPVADQLKALSEGRMPFPSGMAMKTPYWQMMVQHLSHYDPSFDAVNYNARAATRKDFTSGKSAQNVTAFNTAISHLETLDKAAEALNNSGVPMWNKVANAARAAYDPEFASFVKRFETARTAVADELTRAFRGAGGNVHDIKQWESNINGADSPQALKAAIQQGAELLYGRISSVGDTYNRGMGTTKEPLHLLSPKAASAMQRWMSGDHGAPPSVSVPGGTVQAMQPVKVSGPEEAAKLPPGTRFITPDGQERVVK